MPYIQHQYRSQSTYSVGNTPILTTRRPPASSPPVVDQSEGCNYTSVEYAMNANRVATTASRTNDSRHQQSTAAIEQSRVPGQSIQASNLTMMMMQHESRHSDQQQQQQHEIMEANAALSTQDQQIIASQSTSSEADSACEIPRSRPVILGSSAPGITSRSRSPSNFVRITNQHRSVSIGPGGKEWASERVRR